MEFASVSNSPSGAMKERTFVEKGFDPFDRTEAASGSGLKESNRDPTAAAMRGFKA